MGDALVSGLVSDVVRKLTSIVIQEIGLLRRLRKDVLTLRDDFNKIQAVLEDAEDKQTKEKAVELWLKSLRSASLEVQNVLDEVSTEAMLQSLHKERGVIYIVRAFFSSDHNHFMVRTRIAHKVKSITKKIAHIAAEKDKFSFTPTTISVDLHAGVITGEMPNRETSSMLIHSSMIYGRDKETEMVTNKICNKDIHKHEVVNGIPVYAIWGMGGLGKTTLAQLVYNHEKVNKHFEIKRWMYVSEKFQLKELIKGVIESIGDGKDIPSQLDALQVRLQKNLQGKRFFIVLDDIWIEDEEKSEWDKLSNVLSCGAEGSIVLVTTRNKTTSRMMAKVPELQHELGCLSKEDSWLLFEKLSFAEGRAGGDRRELEPIGKEIVEKCKGLPLAVKTLGGLMWSKRSRRDWEDVMSSNIWELKHNNILPSLKLSYDNLLPHIKRCFAYCCLFPKGYEMKKDLLILLWMTNEFIPTRGEANWYLIGEEIYNCLVWRSFFQVVDEKYKMHDMMHDLAQYVMGDDCLVIKPGKKKPITQEEVLHLSSSSPDFVYSMADLEKLRSLRSAIIFNAYDYKGSVSHMFQLLYLRVLCLFEIDSLPDAICKLKYLKYLNISDSWIENLPKSIIYLQNLQVLIMERCESLRKLPEGIRYIKNLQHLNVMGCDSLKYLPEGIRYMRNLQHLNIKHCTKLEYLPAGILKEVNDVRLTHYPICEKKGATIGELGDLNHLEDEMVIKGLGNVKGGSSEAKNANLKSKSNMLVLKLYWRAGYELERISVDEEEVLEGLEPNPSLKELEIYDYLGKKLSPSWIVNLNNLVRIGFYSLENCEIIPPLGKLHGLKVIKLSVMNSLKRFNDEDNTSKSEHNTTTLFLSLQELHIMYCPKLVSLPSYFPNLNKLYIEHCRSMVSLPDEIQSFKYLYELKIKECENLRRRYDKETGGVDWPKISHIPRISIKRYYQW